MRILKKIFFFLFVLVVLAAFGAYIFVKTFDLNKVKPQIIAEAGRILGRQVNFDKISLTVTLRSGVGVLVHNLSIAEDPAFGKADFLNVKSIAVKIDVLGYILQKAVSISGILIDSPRLSIIRNKDGAFNVQTLTQPASPGKNTAAPAQASSPALLPAIFISSLQGHSGNVVYMDRTFDPAVRLEIADLSFDLSKVSMTEAFPFFIEASVLSADKNLKVKGNLRFDLKTSEVTVTDLNAQSELSGISLEKIPVSLPMVKAGALPSQLGGVLGITVRQLTASSGGAVFFPADVSLSDGNMRFKDIPAAFTGLSLLGVINEKKVIVTKFACAVGEGRINGSGEINDYLTFQDFSAQAQLKDLKAEDLIPIDKTPVKVEGVISGKLKCTGKGFSPEALKEALFGSADLTVSNGKLKDINVLRAVLDKIAIIPGLTQKVEAGLPGSYRKILTQEDTALSDMYLSMNIANGRLTLKDTLLGASEFQYKGSGDIGFDGTYALDGSFLIPAELSARMVDSVSELEYLLNEDKQIYLPLKISGKVGEFKLKVNIEYISKKIVTDQAKQQILKAVDKYLGPKGSASPDAGQVAPETAQSSESEKTSTKEAIGSLLEKLFKK
ncbi:MAG: AsmA family protein [Candidatus Omnitrophota bacterium]